MLITNNHIPFTCDERKIWPNINESQNIMTMIAVFKIYSLMRHPKNRLNHLRINHEFTKEIGLDWITSATFYQVGRINLSLTFLAR